MVDDVVGQVVVPEEFASEAEAAAFIAAVDRSRARMDSLRLKAVAAAQRSKVAAARGSNGTGAWLAGTSRATGQAAARDVRLATALDGGLPVTGAALDDGVVSSEHAAVIADAITRLPAGLDPVEVEAAEAQLVQRATQVDPAVLRKEARRVLEHTTASLAEVNAHHDALVRDEEAEALAKLRLTWRDNQDGTINLWATMPTFAGQILIKALESLTSPRRRSVRAAQAAQAVQAAGATGAGVTGAGATTDSAAVAATAATSTETPASGQMTDWAHERGKAFAELLEHLPTDTLLGRNGATLLVTMTREELVAEPEAPTRPARVETGHEISAGEARRVACNAGLVPAVLGSDSAPLDLGYSKRLFTENQRRALALTYDACAAEGCDRPFAWTEQHHLTAWEHGGTTDLANAVPLCWQDHRRIHDPSYVHERIRESGGRLTIRFHRQRP